MPGRKWEAWEEDYVRKWYYKKPPAEIAAKVCRTDKAVLQRAQFLGLSRPNVTENVVLRYVEKYHPLGYSGYDIEQKMRADGVTTGRWRVSKIRRKFGFASNVKNDRHVQKLKRASERQMKREGVKNLGELRSKVFSQFAPSRGWPEGLSVRQAMVLEALWRLGPLPRREIAKAIGMKHDGPSKSILKCTDRNSSLTASLLRRGLIIRMHKADRILGKVKGRTRDLYALKPGIEPNGKAIANFGRGQNDGSAIGDPIDATDVDGSGVQRDSRGGRPADRGITN